MTKPKKSAVAKIVDRDAIIREVRAYAHVAAASNASFPIHAVGLSEAQVEEVKTALGYMVALFASCEASRARGKKRGKDTRINQTDAPYWKAVRMQIVLDSVVRQTQRKTL